MGNQISKDLLRGIVEPDTRISDSTLKDVGTGPTDSAYTEAGSFTGEPVPSDTTKLTLLASGDQTKGGHIEIKTQNAGFPVPDRYGANYIWRDVGNRGEEEYIGWDPPIVISEWDDIDYSTISRPTPYMSVIRLQTGDLLAAGFVEDTGKYQVRTYSVSTATWGSGVDVGVQDMSNTRQGAIVQLPDESILYFLETPDSIQVDVYRSDDSGATWALAAERCLETAILDISDVAPSGGLTKLVAGYSNGEILLCVEYENSETTPWNEIQQYASADLGGTFQRVVGPHGSSTGTYTDPSIIGLKDGGFVLGIQDPNSNLFSSTYEQGTIRLASAYQAFTAGTPANFWNGSSPVTTSDRNITIWEDEDGIMYAIYRVPDSGATFNAWVLEESTDFGISWNPYASWLHSTEDSDNYLWGIDIAATGGSSIGVTRFYGEIASNYEDNSVAHLRLGGFSSHTAPDSYIKMDDYFHRKNTTGFTEPVGSSSGGLLFMPIDEPDNMGWTLSTGAAGNGLLTANAEFSITTANTERRLYRKDDGTEHKKLWAEFAVSVTPGSGDASTDEVIWEAILCDTAANTWDIQPTIRIVDTGLQVYDKVAAANVGSFITLDMTTTQHIRVAIEYIDPSGYIRIWAREDSDGQERRWVEKLSGTLSDGSGISSGLCRVRWGHNTDVANHSRWKQNGFSYTVNAWARDPNYYSMFSSSYSTPECLAGRAYSITPQYVSDGVYITAIDGPTYIPETWDIETDYQYPIERIDPRISSSPTEQWRSIDTASDVLLTWDTESLFSDGVFDNGIIAVMFLNANFKTALLQMYNTGTSTWNTISTFNASAGFTALNYVRKGQKVFPNTSAASFADEYFYHEDMAGDTWDFGVTGESPRYVKIKHNSEGAWIGNQSTTKRPTLWLDEDNLDSGSATTGASGALWRRNFGGIIKNWTSTFDQIRIKIPAQSTADGDFRLGNLVIGPVTVFGRQHDRGWKIKHKYKQSISELPGGTIRVHRDGAPHKELEMNWVKTSVDYTLHSLDAPTPDYVTAESVGKLPVAAIDTTRTIEGFLYRIEGAVTPILLLTDIDTTEVSTAEITQTVSATRAWFWGRIIKDIEVDNVLGDENRSEVERLRKVTVREEI